MKFPASSMGKFWAKTGMKMVAIMADMAAM
jgi:hypothetical protein